MFWTYKKLPFFFYAGVCAWVRSSVRKFRITEMPPFGSLSLLNGLSVLIDRHIDDLRLLRSLCRLFRFIVLRHYVVDGIASHRACGCTCDSRPEAAARGRGGLGYRLVDDGGVFLHDRRALGSVGSGRSRTGERSATAEASTATCISGSGDKKSGYDSRQENLFHFFGDNKNPAKPVRLRGLVFIALSPAKPDCLSASSGLFSDSGRKGLGCSCQPDHREPRRESSTVPG